MNCGQNLRPAALRGAFACLALALGLTLSPGSAAASAQPGQESLSPRLAQLSTPAVRSDPSAEQAKQLSLAPSGPGSLAREGGRVLAEVRFDGGAVAAADALRDAGAEIVAASARYQTVTVAVRPADLPAVGAVARVGAVTEILTPILRAADCGGSVRSEGDAQLNAPQARAALGIDGSGVTVGILSDSFDRDAGAVTHAAGDVTSGDLPGAGSPCGSTATVGLLDDSEAAGADEGRAMAQIVHDLAPGAAIDFASAFGGQVQFAANIRALAAAGAKVIVDDVGYFEEPFFQDGPVAVAVEEVTAAGVSYLSSAGNDNLIDSSGRDIASWEAPAFRNSGSCPAAMEAIAGLKASRCQDFDPGAGVDSSFGITVSKGATLTVDLQWAEAWNGVGTDLDALLLDAAGKPIEVQAGGGGNSLVGSIGDNIASQRPVEIFQWQNTTGAAANVQLAINRYSGAAPRLKFALLQNGSGVTATEYPASTGGDVVGPTIYGHGAAAGAISTAAVPYNNGSAVERYSSRGPVKHYFGPVKGAGAAPASGEQVIAKPDIAATDCGATTFFASLQAGVWRFCGTSAAAPHAAAVAALIRQAGPSATDAEVRAALTSTARPVGALGPTAVGAGLVDAEAAVVAPGLPSGGPIEPQPGPVAEAPPVETVPTFLPSAVDATAPETAIPGRPRKLVRTRGRSARVIFRFASSEADVSFYCKVDREPLRRCAPRLARRLRVGRHVIRVKSRDQAGNVDPTPAVARFRIKQIL